MAVLTPYWVFDVALVFLSALVAAYLYMTRNFKYWSKRGVTEISPLPFVGNFLDCCLFRRSSAEHFGLLYKRGKGLPYLGFYIFDKPALLLRDPDIIKQVLVKNFDYFADRYVSTHKSDTLGSANMFVLKNPHWKTVRRNVSPIFTALKMKGMFGMMLEIGNELITHVDAVELQRSGRVIDVKNLSAKYTTDVIATCAFGLQANSLNDPKSVFRKYGSDIAGFVTYKRSAEFALFFFAPAVAELLELKFFDAEASDFMRDVFNKALTLRMETNTRRNDLIDLLVELKKSHEHVKDPDAYKFDGDNLVGQAATFFGAGFETSATTMAFSVYELALHPVVQSRLREEIISALEESGGEITYEMVTQLPYLDMVVSETLRKYPSLAFLDRVPISDYQVPGTDFVIEKGTPVYVSLLGLHYDPEYFPDPDKYDPERFSKENRQELPSCVYLPFGDGPRNCVGFRFGLLQAKLGIFELILHHEVTPCPQTPIPIQLAPKATLLSSKDGLYLNFRRITTSTKIKNKE